MISDNLRTYLDEWLRVEMTADSLVYYNFAYILSHELVFFQNIIAFDGIFLAQNGYSVTKFHFTIKKTSSSEAGIPQISRFRFVS